MKQALFYGSGPYFLLALACYSRFLSALCSECSDRKGREIFDLLPLFLWCILVSVTQRREQNRMTLAFHLLNFSWQLSCWVWSKILTNHLWLSFTLRSVKIRFSQWYTHRMRCPFCTSGGWNMLKVCFYLWNNDALSFFFSAWLEHTRDRIVNEPM